MGFFGGPKTLYTGKQIKFKNAKNSSAMKDLMSKEGVSRVLDKGVERDEFYSRLKKNAGSGGVTRDIIRKTLGDFRQGRGREIDKKEAQKLASLLIPNRGFGTKRYIFTKEERPLANRMNPLAKKINEPAGGEAPSGSRLKGNAEVNLSSLKSERMFGGIVRNVKTRELGAD